MGSSTSNDIYIYGRRGNVKDYSQAGLHNSHICLFTFTNIYTEKVVGKGNRLALDNPLHIKCMG